MSGEGAAADVEVDSVFGAAEGVSGGAAADDEVNGVFGAAGGVSGEGAADAGVNGVFGDAGGVSNAKDNVGSMDWDWDAVEVAWSNDAGVELYGGGVGAEKGMNWHSASWVHWYSRNAEAAEILDGSKSDAMAEMQLWLSQDQEPGLWSAESLVRDRASRLIWQGRFGYAVFHVQFRARSESLSSS